MKLGQVFQALNVWQIVATMKLRNPKVAYRVLKYLKRVQEEFATAEQQRVAIIRDITGTKDGEDAMIEPDTSQFREYLARFEKVLSLDCDLEKIDMEIDDLLDAAEGGYDNALSPADLAVIEPFFREA